MIFAPFGFLMHAMLRIRRGLTVKCGLLALAAAAGLTLGVEIVQHFSISRNSSLIDVCSNVSGALIGITMDRAYGLLLRHRAQRFEACMPRDEPV